MLPKTSKFLKRNLLLWTAAGLIATTSPWGIQESLGTPGEPCETNNDCDVCNRETCQPNIPEQENQCRNAAVDDEDGFDPASDPTPACPGFTTQEQIPACWTTCSEITIDGTLFAECAPDDSFCESISGGNDTSECRSATCTDVEVVDPENPSGCNFEFDGSDEEVCILCADPQPDDFDACGNGICEKPDETFGNCEEDCRVPGFNGGLLNEGNDVLDAACADEIIVPAATRAISFNPDNIEFSGFCEDGDICTNNVCNEQTGECDVTPKACSLDDSDLCCPAGCEPPAEGEDCANDTGCDVDCFIPTDCEEPPPPPPPPGVVDLSGSGCALNSGSSVSGTGSAMFFLLGIGVAAFLSMRKRNSEV